MAGLRKYNFTAEQVAAQPIPGLRVVWSSHGYKGIEYDKRNKKWRAYIGGRRQGNLVRLYGFDTAKDAAQAYDQLAKDRYGEGAFLNFPLNGERGVLVKKDGYCGYGHVLTEENTHVSTDGRKQCRRCFLSSVAKYHRRTGKVKT